MVFFQQKILHSPDKLPADNCRYINGDIHVESWLFQKINVAVITFNYSFARTN